MKHSIKIILIIIIGFVSLSGCQYLKKKVIKTENETYTLSTLNKTSLSVSNVSGKINFYSTNDSNTVIINATKTGKVSIKDKDKPLDNIKVEIDSSTSVIKVSTKAESDYKFFGFTKDNSTKVDYDIYIGSNIEILIDNTNGSIELNRLSNNTTISVVNGGTKLIDYSGRLKLDCVNGKLTGNIDSTSGIEVDVVNGSVNLVLGEKVKGELRANTTNGKIKYSGLNLKDISKDDNSLTAILDTNSITINIDVINGKITLSGKKGNNPSEKGDKNEEVMKSSEKFYSIIVPKINDRIVFE